MRARPRKTQEARSPRAKNARAQGRCARPALARVNDQVMLDVYANGKVGAYCRRLWIEIGHISPAR